METNDINQYILEFLRFHNYTNTLECFEAEIRTKQVSSKLTGKVPGLTQKTEDLPKIYGMIKGESAKTKRETTLDKEFKAMNKKYNQVLQAARQIFSVSVSCLQLLHSQNIPNISETFENYKIQLGKYHKVIINEGKPEGGELITEQVMQEHKTKLLTHYKEKNVDGIIEVLLSLRVNALQIAPELRKNLVYELVRNDIFLITENDSFDFPMGILEMNNSSLKHAITSLISVVASTLKGVEYLCHGNKMQIVEKIIKILKEQENGSVTQRFCIAILQKCSIKDTIIPTFIEHDMIYWTINLINKSLTSKIHVFCLDFASAMLANIIHTPSTLQLLERNRQLAKQIMESLLRLMKENIPISVLMHILIALSYLSRDSFQNEMRDCQFEDRISTFVEQYSQINTAENEAVEIDKKTVLDLCAHMFHPKDTTTDNSETMEMNELKTEDRIREYENEQGELIFECFQDEVS